MRTKRRIIAIIAIIAVFFLVTIGVLLLLPPREPYYHGKSLTQWIWQYRQSLFSTDSKAIDAQSQARDEAKAAVLQMGTNGIQALIYMVETKDSALRRFVGRRVPKSLVWRFGLADAITRYTNSVATNPRTGQWGFELLGPAAQSAVPDLARVLRTTDNPYGRFAAAYSLGCIGPSASNALPDLARDLRKPWPDLPSPRDVTIDAIHRIACENWSWSADSINILVPLLIEGLQDPAASKPRILAMLKELGPTGKPAAIAILPLLKSMDTNVQSGAVEALRRVDPDSAAKLGIE